MGRESVLPPTTARTSNPLSPPQSTTSPKPQGVTIKTGRRRLPHNIPSVPIDSISFHHEENAQRWKYVVQRHLADELNVSDKHQSCVTIIDLISQVWSISYHPEC
ncbi:hypothetical protein Csa_019972 [Cucumis sativus]|nr:hypothetical protein Csa_019972 [Cucumis sativus]